MGKIKNTGKETLDTLSKVGIFAGSLLFATVAVYFYSPVIGSYADESGTAEVSVDVQPIASLTTDVSEINLDVVPTSAGAFDSDSIVATVSTNSLGGYELYFSSEDNSTDMTHSNSSITDVIASDFNDTVTSSTMAANKWGYSLDNTNFSKIPTLASHAIIRNLGHIPSAAEKNTTVYIGTKISADLTSGSYSKNVKFSVIAHETPGPSLFSISDMQDMTPTICANTTTPVKEATAFDWDGSHRGDTDYVPRKSLRDSRDGNYYLVSKLADGNCWMSQNLALDLTANTPVEASNIDGTTMMVTPDNTTQTTTGQIWEAIDNYWRSYHPQASESYYQEGKTMSSLPSGSGVEYDWEKAGNSYNWYAATAGTGTKTLDNNTNATASICPKGWRLPASTGAKSNNGLITTTYRLTYYSHGGATKMRADPLNYIAAGAHNTSFTGKMYNQGLVAYYWSSTAYTDSSSARHMFFRTEDDRNDVLYPDSYINKGIGNSVRCVAL